MNKGHIGDNLDLLKRAVLSACAHVFDNLLVEPLVTNADWTGLDYQNYADVLGIESDQVRTETQPTWASLKKQRVRLEWLSRLNEHRGDLFFDPDTGLEPPSGGTRLHLPIATVAELTRVGEKCRVVMVYQHVPQGTKAEVSDIVTVMRAKVAAVRGEALEINCLATIGQMACLLCFCRDRARLDSFEKALAWLKCYGRLIRL